MKIIPALTRHLRRKFPVIHIQSHRGDLTGIRSHPYITISHADRTIYIRLRPESLRISICIRTYNSTIDIDLYDPNFITKIEDIIADTLNLNP